MTHVPALLARTADFDWRSFVASPLCWALLAGAVGIWLMLPGGGSRVRVAGSLIAAVGLGLLGSLLPQLGDLSTQILFWILAGLTAISAVATISMRSPVYCAIWFALTLLTTAGLFLLQGAQFLGVATMVVYAGAILVTFLFVLMLAQPEGHAYYDRISWGRFAPAVATIAAIIIVGGLTHILTNLDEHSLPHAAAAAVNENRVIHEQHVAKLGGQLFSRHLVSVEVAGTLLLVALVGAIAIVIQGKEKRATDAQARQMAASPGGSSDA